MPNHSSFVDPSSVPSRSQEGEREHSPLRNPIGHHRSQSTAVSLPSLFGTEQSLPVPSRVAAGSRAENIVWLFRHGNLSLYDPLRSWGCNVIKYLLQLNTALSSLDAQECINTSVLEWSVHGQEFLLPHPGFVRHADQPRLCCAMCELSLLPFS
jgi:hypothetical protein